MSPVRIAVTGAAGRMGQRLVALAHQGEGTVVAAATEHPTHGQIGHDAGQVAGIGTIGVTLTPDLGRALEGADVVIDFSTPEATLAHVELCGRLRKAMVIGTTGLSAAQKEAISGMLSGVPYVIAPNMSVGVNLLLKLLSLAAAALDDTYDVDIVETHHRHKVDAPSGTALAMAEAVARGRGVSLDTHAVYDRHALHAPRQAGTIGLQSLRVGDVAGDHTVVFGTDGERVEIGHRASSRDTFARGAIRAARWVARRPAGRYDMQDVLGLR